jgi:hypothetical protein
MALRPVDLVANCRTVGKPDRRTFLVYGVNLCSIMTGQKRVPSHIIPRTCMKVRECQSLEWLRPNSADCHAASRIAASTEIGGNGFWIKHLIRCLQIVLVACYRKRPSPASREAHDCEAYSLSFEIAGRHASGAWGAARPAWRSKATESSMKPRCMSPVFPKLPVQVQ